MQAITVGRNGTYLRHLNSTLLAEEDSMSCQKHLKKIILMLPDVENLQLAFISFTWELDLSKPIE